MLELTLPPNRSPSIQAYARQTALPVGAAITGTAVALRPTLYEFDAAGLADGDYVVDITNPAGRFVLRKNGEVYLMADEWWQLDYLTDPALDPGKVLVDENFGGSGALTYQLDGSPVEDASIEVFLLSDYVAGNCNGNHRLNSSRQKIDGTWAVPFYLDPQNYVLRFYKSGVAGPDEWQIVVSQDPDEIEIIPLSAAGAAALRLQPSPVLPATVAVDHNYGGPFALSYRLNGVPLEGAVIQIFAASDYNSGHRQASNVVGQTEQLADGSWVKAIRLVPGHYLLHCFKKNVAGPNTYNLTVE